MATAGQIVRAKRSPVTYTIGPEESVYEALRLMAEKNIGGLVVMEGGTIVGMFTERDYARKVVLQSRTSRETRVADVMASPVVCVGPHKTNEECMGLMTAKRVRHLPVVEGGRLVGIVSIGDLVKDIIAEQRFTIEQLEHYIAS
ncbi:MAG TPA: CBS domain-containing protein [Usitatibacter sp.]|nr:CBS domain-containing protein [Usitatibacter sp.]